MESVKNCKEDDRNIAVMEWIEGQTIANTANKAGRNITLGQIKSWLLDSLKAHEEMHKVSSTAFDTFFI